MELVCKEFQVKKDPKSNEDVTEGAKVKIVVVTNRVRRLPETTKRRPKKEWRGNFRNCIRTERQYRRKKTNGVKKIKQFQRIVEVKGTIYGLEDYTTEATTIDPLETVCFLRK
ncbi:hypothetical protein Goklo_007980, partial [Gossypium klotzschianum]|nr:hypothetical protein [Gossypium klotzschianum]